MPAAFPVNQQFDVAVIRDRRHDLLDEQAHQVLLGPPVGVGMRPQRGEFLRQRQEHRPIGRRGWDGCGGQMRDTLLEGGHALQGGVPPLLQGRRDEPVLGLDGIVLPLCPLCLIARLTELKRYMARGALRVYSLPPTVVPPVVAPGVGAATLAEDLAALGYPGFAHLARRGGAAKHPGAVLLTALAQPELEARAVEALPWLLLRYWSLDPAWLAREAKVRDLQNRLGFVVSLAREVAEREGHGPRLAALRALEATLEQSRLAREDTLGPAALSEAEQRWLETRRSATARHWNLLTDWTAEALRHRT